MNDCRDSCTTGTDTDPNGGDLIDVLTAVRVFLNGMTPRWMTDAACSEHPQLDFHSSNVAEISRCIAICGRCPVREECRAFADETGDVQAVLGGEDPAARRARWRVRGRRDEGVG